ncbi:MAG: DUF59 domain-containing protein [Myxococcales bacterium]|nr:MAG: DUF59 domain-containing protein [Myxococcales bacterium]
MMSEHPENKRRLPMNTPAAWTAPQGYPEQDYQANAPGQSPEFEIDKLNEELIVEALKTIYDPEIPLNIYELGLIYGVDIDENRAAFITMTLTAPACPVAGSLVEQVAEKVANVPGVRHAYAKVVWDPPWDKDRMSEAAKLELGLL